MLIARVGRGFGHVIDAEESKQVAVLPGDAERYLSKVF